MSAACLVADSGPLIALGRLDLLGLPSRYFGLVLVTSSVWLEVTRKPGVDEAARLSSAAEHHLLRVVPDPAAIPAALLRTSIHAGERSSIALAIEREATLLLDDRRARRSVPRARGDEPKSDFGLQRRHYEQFLEAFL